MLFKKQKLCSCTPPPLPAFPPAFPSSRMDSESCPLLGRCRTGERFKAVCVQAPSPCALDRTAAWLLNMNSTSSYGDAEEDRQEDSLIEKVGAAPPLRLLCAGPFRLVGHHSLPVSIKLETFLISSAFCSISRRLHCYRRNCELQRCVRMSVKPDF